MWLKRIFQAFHTATLPSRLLSFAKLGLWVLKSSEELVRAVEGKGDTNASSQLSKKKQKNKTYRGHHMSNEYASLCYLDMVFVST